MSLTSCGRLVSALLAVVVTTAAWAQERSGDRQVAVTFDDLPGVTGPDTDHTYLPPFNERLLQALRKHQVPAIGFVNEGKLQERQFAHGAGLGMLQQWIEAGFELGNHTYSHTDLHRVPLHEYQQDVVRGEPITRRLMEDAGKRVRFFRHTFLHTGRDAKTRDGFEAFLAKRGYQVAPVTIDNYDYLFARAYERAIGDGKPQDPIVDAYVDYMTRVVAYYEEQSRRFLGREIPQVLLLHANALNASRSIAWRRCSWDAAIASCGSRRRWKTTRTAAAMSITAPAASRGCTAGRSPRVIVARRSPASQRCPIGFRRAGADPRRWRRVRTTEPRLSASRSLMATARSRIEFGVRICIFCGSSTGRDPAFAAAARELATEMARRGIEIVYGGGNVGLMGVVADAALDAGGRVTGVIPGALVAREIAHQRLTALHVVDSMHQRKALMAELSDGFIALPGGFGTLEEFCEVVTWTQLGVHAKPCGLLNAAGFYDGLLSFLAHALDQQFLRPTHFEIVVSAEDPVTLLDRVLAWKAPQVARWIAQSEV